MTVADKPWNMPIFSEEGEQDGIENQTETAVLNFEVGGENPSICYYVSGDTMGKGDQTLGADLLVKFFQAMADKCMHPDYVVLVNSGVNVAREASPVSTALKSLEKRGTKVLISEDSVNYYEVRTEIDLGVISSVEEILIVVNGVDKVVTL